jgi:uncharacterized protein YdhG (YjbR/CyaY superfamily)
MTAPLTFCADSPVPASSSRKKDPKPAAAAQVRTYFAKQPAAQRATLKKLRHTIRAAAPGAVENFSYGIPGFRLDGATLVWYAAWKTHTSLYPLTGGMRRANEAELEQYKTAKGTVQFPLDEPLPVALVRRLVKARVAEIRAKAKA